MTANEATGTGYDDEIILRHVLEPLISGSRSVRFDGREEGKALANAWRKDLRSRDARGLLVLRKRVRKASNNNPLVAMKDSSAAARLRAARLTSA